MNLKSYKTELKHENLRIMGMHRTIERKWTKCAEMVKTQFLLDQRVHQDMKIKSYFSILDHS
jgi:hypothetical protein